MNRCKCKLCGDVIESKFRHDFVRCKCGEIFTDGGDNYFHRGALHDLNNIIDMSQTLTESEKCGNIGSLEKEEHED